MINQTIFANEYNYGTIRNVDDIKYIVIHYTANDGDTAVANALYFRNNKVNASAHYFVDETEIINSVPEMNVAWSVGGALYRNAYATGGGKLYLKCTNYNSLNIEMCSYKKDGVFTFNQKTIENTVKLTADLMERYNIPLKNVIRHFDVNGKICPAPFINNDKWNMFKDRVKKELSGMNENEIEKIVKKLMPKTYKKIENIPSWAIPSVKKAIDKKLIVGDERGNLNLSEDVIKILVIMDRNKNL